MKSIAISGIRGFVGKNLDRYLKSKGEVVFGVSRKKDTNYTNYKNLDINFFNKQKTFIHLAGKAHDLKKTSNSSEYFEVNTELTKKLFDQFLKSDCEVFIYMSSVKAAADKVDGILSEDCVPKPKTVYGKSKLAAENYIISKEIPKNKRVYILRPCMIHGPNNKGNLNLLYGFVVKGFPYPFGEFKNKRSFVSIDNLCFIIKELLENKSIDSGVYNISDDNNISTNQLVSIIGRVLSKKVRILNVPKGVIKILAKLGDIIPMPINSEKLQKLTENYVVSNRKIKKAIQKELPLTLKEGLEKTITSF